MRPPTELENPVLPSKAHLKYPGPKETAFQIQVSSHNHFLTSELSSSECSDGFLAEPSPAGPATSSEKAAPIQSLAVGFSQGLNLQSLPLGERNLSRHVGPHSSKSTWFTGDPGTAHPTTSLHSPTRLTAQASVSRGLAVVVLLFVRLLITAKPFGFKNLLLQRA
ncbi:unnamed protein product [Rangifer tarandus platyrhynchus]|uniref:Uncharacterized protein n=2 Tax=Rangifer tarandus platyrhynchus TaxID=3082113 RepID=A0ABN8ZLX0_RANTA|nr:unnamed protein product [Rangifer tarandus platyrhynchus]CAI9706551.1 unnamed protein product [Rangifer tarandus platyrhynchus]